MSWFSVEEKQEIVKKVDAELLLYLEEAFDRVFNKAVDRA